MAFNETTQGIVLSTIPYNDRVQMVHIYTERYGKLTYRCPVARSRKLAALRTAMAPMTLIDLAVRPGPRWSDVHLLGEVSVAISPYALAAADPWVTSQCLYMAELIDRSVREVEANPGLWRYLTQALALLATHPAGEANFHLVFTIGLCRQLGFHIDATDYAEGLRFDISEGRFTGQPIPHPYYLTPESAAWLHRLLVTPLTALHSLSLTRDQRNVLLDMLLLFLQMHIPEMGPMRSVAVLKELFV